MAKPLILSYLHEGKEHEFEFDTYNSTHQKRIIETLQWAARRGVEVYCVPKRREEVVTPKQLAS